MLGSLEREVVATLERLRRGTTRDILEDLRGRGIDVAYTTVGTILSRLYRKHLVERQTESFRGGERHIYLYRDIEQEYIDSLLGGLFAAFGRQGVVHLTERLGEISPEELERLRERLKK
jgi:predicted transcriptional regulator